MPHSSELSLVSRISNAKRLVSVGSLYYHYRTPNLFYRVNDIVVNEETEQPVVIYEAQYGDKITWARSLDKWLDEIEYQDTFVKRFTEVSDK